MSQTSDWFQLALFWSTTLRSPAFMSELRVASQPSSSKELQRSELQRELSPSQRSLAKEAAPAQPFEVFRQRVLRTVATTRLHIRATSSFLVGAGPDRRRLRASSKARNWQR